MARKLTRYTDDFKNTIVELYNSGKSLSELNREYGISKSTVQVWVTKAMPVSIEKHKVVTTSEYQAMMKKMARLEEENEILKKAMAIFAKK